MDQPVVVPEEDPLLDAVPVLLVPDEEPTSVSEPPVVVAVEVESKPVEDPVVPDEVVLEGGSLVVSPPVEGSGSGGFVGPLVIASGKGGLFVLSELSHAELATMTSGAASTRERFLPNQDMP